MSSELPAGIYRITLAGSKTDDLTRQGENNVTLLSVGAVPVFDQEWFIAPTAKNYIIQRPKEVSPYAYLSYVGAPKPQEGSIILYQVTDVPLTEWHLESKGEFRYHIRVPGTDLGIRYAPETIFPPILELGLKNQLEFVFQRVRGV